MVNPVSVSAAIDHVGAAVGHPLEHRPHDVRPAGAACHAQQRAAGAVVPMRRAEPEQGGDEHHSVGRRTAGRDVVALGARGDQAEVVAKPFDTRASRQHDRLDAPRERTLA